MNRLPNTSHRGLFVHAALTFAMIFLLSECALANLLGVQAVTEDKEDRIQSWLTSASEYAEAGRYQEAVRAYEAAIRIKPDPSAVRESKARRWAQNNLAWLLSTCPDGSVRDGKRAMALAQEVLAAFPRDIAYLDTLAAALAETGQFEEAVRTVQEALDNVPRRVSKNHPTVVGLNKHLASYKDRRPWREA